MAAKKVNKIRIAVVAHLTGFLKSSNLHLTVFLNQAAVLSLCKYDSLKENSVEPYLEGYRAF